MASSHTKQNLHKDENSNENDIIDDEDLDQDDVIDNSCMCPPETLQKSIVCNNCNSVFNGQFVKQKERYGRERQMGWDVWITYMCEDECPKCGVTSDQEISVDYYVDPNGIAYNYDRQIFYSEDIDSSIRKQIKKPVICSYCRRKFNAIYNIIDSFDDSEEVEYKCETTCPRLGCPGQIIDTISDFYFIENDSILYERGDYSDEGEVEDNLYEFDRNDSDEHNSYNVINQGKGDSAVIVIGKCVIIYDFGYMVYAEHLSACLRKIGKKIDIQIVILIISHDDRDHINGLKKLISYLRNLKPVPELFLLSPLDKKKFDADKDIKVLGDERNFNTGSVIINLNDESKLQVVYPKFKHDKKNNNKNSLIAIIFTNNRTIVLTGDQHFHEIDQALNKFDIKQTAILQIPHHGSLHNIDGYKPLIPSEYYIISGTPKNDGKSETSENYKYNQKCQTFLAEKVISTKQAFFPVYLVFTQTRIVDAWKTQLQKKGINVISVDNGAYHSISLAQRISRTIDTKMVELCQDTKTLYGNIQYEIPASSTSYFAIQLISRGPPYGGTIDTFDLQSLTLHFYANFSFYLPPDNHTDVHWFTPGPVAVIDQNQSTIITALQSNDFGTPLHLFRYNIPTKTYIQSLWILNSSHFDYLHYDPRRQRLFGSREVNISLIVIEEYNTTTLNLVQVYTQLTRSQYGYPPRASIFDPDENWLVDIRVGLESHNPVYYMKMDLNLVGKSENIVTAYHPILKHGMLLSMIYDMKTKRAFVIWDTNDILTGIVMLYMNPHTGEFHQERSFVQAPPLWSVSNLQASFDESTRQVIFFMTLSNLLTTEKNAWIIQVEFDTMKIIKQTQIYPEIRPIEWSFFVF